MIKLNDLFSNVEILESLYGKNVDIFNIAYHTDHVVKDSLFVCIKGYVSDGHVYLEKALKNGASAAIVEEFQEEIKIPQYKVENARVALALLSSNFYDNPSKKMTMIGITATNGKTTTAFMTDSILKKHKLKTGMVGTVVVRIGDKEIASYLTTPESADLHMYFKKMVDVDTTHLIMEVSSAALEMNRVYGIEYDIVTMNNINRDHIDLHGSFDKYYNAKAKLIREAKEGKWAIINIDCPYSRKLVGETKANVLTYGIENDDAIVSVRNLDLSTGRAKFDVFIQRSFEVHGFVYNPFNFHIELPVPGFHSIYNSMMAILISLVLRIPIDTIKEGLNDFVGVERRFEFIYEKDFKIVDDHFANGGNIDVTFETMKHMKYNDLYLVYAIRGSRGVTVNRENAEAIVKWSKILGFSKIIATTSSSLMTVKDIVTEDEKNVLYEVLEKNGIEIDFYEELEDAIEKSLSLVKDDDVILLGGCQGMDHGARIMLNKIHDMNPDIDEEELFKPLEKRVAGII